MGQCRGMCKHERGDQERQKDNRTQNVVHVPSMEAWKRTECVSDRICLCQETQLYHKAKNLLKIPRVSPSHVPQVTFHVPETSIQDFLPFSRQNIPHFLNCPLRDTSPLGSLPSDPIQAISAHLKLLGQNQTSINNSRPVLSVLNAALSVAGLIGTLSFH